MAIQPLIKATSAWMLMAESMCPNMLFSMKITFPMSPYFQA